MSLAVQSDLAADTKLRKSPARRRTILWIVYLLSFSVFMALLADGYSYYSTPYIERPHQADYRSLRPAGSRGLAYGIIGASMMVLMLAYTLRKRTRLLGRRIPLRHVLDFHIFLGVFGPLLIVLHTSFKVQGLVAIAFWSMAAVALSGYVGRYLHQQIPRSADDRDLSLKETEDLISQTRRELEAHSDISDQKMELILGMFDRGYGAVAAASGASLMRLFALDLRRPWTRARLRRQIHRLTRLDKPSQEILFTLASRRAMLRRRLAMLGRVQRLFHYWHVIHKPFAIIMYIIMFVHIGVAVWTGYGWF